MESLDSSNLASRRRSLTQIAHDHVRSVIQAGDIVIDATAGNGHDTLFLINAVGPQGTVYACDIQPIAIERTGKRVAEAFAGAPHAELVLTCGNHAAMRDFIRDEHRDRIACVMFNLGYLPSGDKAVITSLDDTMRAIAQAASLLAPQGCLSVLAYTGHQGGKEEAQAVAKLLQELVSGDCGTLVREPEVDVHGSPISFFARLNSRRP